MKNYIGQAVGLTAMILTLLLAISMVSEETNIAGFSIRRMDILSDIRNHAAIVQEDTLFTAEPDTAYLTHDTLTVDSPVVHQLIPFADSSQFGQVFEDYSFDGSGLSAFYAAIDEIQPKQKKVRVAFFGDSFVEGDIFLGDLRDTLQSILGGGGVGFVPITSQVARFRRTYIQTFAGWNTFSIIHNEGNKSPLGIDGHVYIPKEGATVTYKGTTQYAVRNTGYWDDIRFFYSATVHSPFRWSFNGNEPVEAMLESSEGDISMWEMKAPHTSSFSASFPATEGLLLYGASLERGPGIYFDNFSVRGNSGGKLKLINTQILKDFERYQQYDLIVLQFGLNAVTNSLRNIGWYEAELKKTFEHVRAAYPDKPILLLSVPDRGGKVDGELTTMVSVPYIVKMQRSLARQFGFIFYDYYHGMGGHGSMVRLSAASRPTLVNKDYTHLTHEGGRIMGIKFAELLLRQRPALIE